jgi:hypothetical protein
MSLIGTPPSCDARTTDSECPREVLAIGLARYFGMGQRLK